MCLQETPNPFYRWSKKGKTPRVKLRKSKDRVYFFGGLSLKLKKVIAHITDRCKTKDFIIFLEQIKITYQQKLTRESPLLVVIDNASIHKSKEIKEWLRQNNKNGCLELFNFPTYSPEFNPQEKVWKAIRKELSNVVALFTFEQVVDRACRLLMTRTFDYQFF